MAGRTNLNDGPDLSHHFVISKDISVEFRETTEGSIRLEVFLNNKRIEASQSCKETNGLETYRWTLRNEIRTFPDDTLILRILRRKKRYRLVAQDERLEEIQLLQKDIADKIKERRQATISFARQICTLALEVTSGDITDMDSSVSDKDLNPLLPTRVEEFLSSNDPFFNSEDVKKLQSVFESIPVTEDAWKVLEDTIKTLGQVHPLAQAILTALSIPYNFLKNEHEFKQNVKDLAEVMHFTCRCLVDVRYHTKITSAKETFVSIMKTLRDAATLINDYTSKGKIDQLFLAQFPGKLEKYAEDLVTLKNNFQTAMVMQIARDADHIASMSSDDFLRKRLRPVSDENQRLGEGCLKDTRVRILQFVRNWLQDYDSKNILWIVGAPGAGKSTIATMIAKEHVETAPFCAKFFCKRDVEALRDPHQIWPTLAYGLADKHNGVKAALMRTLEIKKYDPRDHSVVEQFDDLIKGPLEIDWMETRFQSHKSPYPVIVIDALDECYSAENGDWNSLLESLRDWARLSSGTIKLIITSRDLHDIREALGNVSRRIDLTTGENVSEDDKQDVLTFFTNKFTSIKKGHPVLRSRSDWPGDLQLEEMTNYAAGLFIWADMVIKYVGFRTSGNNPEQRLEAILSDIRNQPEVQRGEAGVPHGLNQVDRLYARIIFEALRNSEPHERAVAKRTLAIIVLAKRPLRKSDIVEFLSTVTSNSKDVLAPMEITLQELSPIIPGVESNETLRVCHKTVSDFLLSSGRSEVAMEYVVREWNRGRPADPVYDPRSFIVDREAENWCLALACVHFACRSFAKEFDVVSPLLTRSDSPLGYAYRYWFEHLDESRSRRMLGSSLECLASAMRIAYTCLERRYANTLVSAMKETVHLTKRLRDAADFAKRCLDGDTGQPAVKDLERECDRETKNLDIARGYFQIAMVVNLAKVNGKSACDASDAFLRQRLQPFNQSLLDSECLKGTRMGVLQEAKKWLQLPDQRNILWIVGAPGSGKSTIATTLVNEFSNVQLCAKAFAKRDFVDRRDPARIWRTLAYEIASLHVGLKGSIMEYLYEESGILKIDVKDQLRFHKGIVKALQEQHGLSVVLIIDALDECFSDDNEQWRALLGTIASCAELPRTFKLVVTSRDIPDIRSALEEVSYPIRLATGSDASVEEHGDIKKFLRTKLTDMRPVRLAEEAIEELTGYAAGSFIWARMVAELVKKCGTVSRVKDILSGIDGGGDVDVLYGKMLLETLGPLDEKARDATRTCLAMIVLARDPLRKTQLIDLFAQDLSSVDEARQIVDFLVQELNSIIAEGDDQALRIPHKSFSDFLLDHDRSLTSMKCLVRASEDPHLYVIRREDESAKLSIACLQIMECSLKFNVCGIETSHKLNEDIPGLSVRVSENVSPTLIYACRFWAEHLRDCDHNDRDLRSLAEPLLKSLLYKNLLHWLEVLSLTMAVPSAQKSLKIAAGVLKGYDSELAEVAEDARQFVERYEEPITAAASHIYLSALAFSPLNSRVTQIYGPQFPSLLSFVEGRQINWGVAATSDHGPLLPSVVFAVAFFPKSMKLVSVNVVDVHVWDGRTGHALSVWTGHERSVICVAVSPDGSQLASGDMEGVLRIWDSDTGACPLGSIKAHDKAIWSVAFSPDGSRIATGSDDKTMKVWNVATGELCLKPLTEHTSDVKSVAFSLDGSVIASGSRDRTIRIWDARTGESRRQPLTEHTDDVYCVAFSLDGRYLASGSDDGTIRLWDVAQGFPQISVIPAGSSVWSLSFSPDGIHLVSCSNSRNRALCFWNVKSGNLERIGDPIYGHTNRVLSVAFSPNGRYVASGSGDSSVKIWTAPTTSKQPTDANNVPESHSNTAGLESMDAHGRVVLTDEAFIDRDGWLRTSRTDRACVLFWVPEENRDGFFWPRNTVVIHRNVTKLDFRRFVHGDNWAECRRTLDPRDV